MTARVAPRPPLVARSIEITPDDCAVTLKMTTYPSEHVGGYLDVAGVALRCFRTFGENNRGATFEFDDFATLVQLRDWLDLLVAELHADGLLDTPNPAPALDPGPPVLALSRTGKPRPRRLRYKPDGGAA